MTYPRAPITEAVIDIRVVPRADLSVEDFRKLAEEFGSEFGTQNDQFRVMAPQSVAAPAAAVVSVGTSTKTGIQFVANTKDKFIHTQVDGWSFSKLAPYRGWEEEFRDQARRLWNAYRAIAQPQTITRVALRYINRLDLPMPMDDIKTYLRTYPEVGPDLPQMLANFYMQLQLPHDDIKAFLVLNMVLVPPAREHVASVILDLDLFRATEVPQREEEIWEYFEILRKRKNEIFEGCITDATRELFR